MHLTNLTSLIQLLFRLQFYAFQLLVATISDKPVVMDMEMGIISRLPEECLSHVISLTIPFDACVSSAVSRDFRSAADSDATWQRFLPSDYASYLFQAVDPVEHASKKALYFRLCDHPIIIDSGLMSFGLEKSTGAKVFMISARKLGIVWGDDSRYWNWIDHPDSRFKCALLKNVCWLEICGTINSEILTPDTSYAAYLIFKLTENAWGLSNPLQITKVTFAGTESEHSARLYHTERAEIYPWWDGPLPGGDREEMADDIIRLPKRRRDGWFEVELGEFYNVDGIDGEVDMSFSEIKGGHWKNGLIVQGIEVRPKH